MSFIKFLPHIMNTLPDLRVDCPHCNSHYFWTRPTKANFEKVGALTVRCRRCNKLYWIIQKRDRSGVYVRTNREDRLSS